MRSTTHRNRGVQIDLIVRSISSPASRRAGHEQDDPVQSIVGRFLEHSRIYYFRNGGEPRSTSAAPT